MQRLHYAGESFYVADDVSTAILNYASALADVGRSDVVTVPIVDEAGESSEAEMLIGPASQLYANPVEHMRDDRNVSDVVEDLRSRTSQTRSDDD